MHWIQDEQPIEYHVVRWDNSAFHNHDKANKRKLLGGVSFDGGGAGGGGTGSTAQGTGVNGLQSSLSDGHGLGLGNGAGLLTESGKTGKSSEGTGNIGKDTVSIHNVQTGTVAKEDVYEIQINTAYLLDSYNKYGERSTLGKD